MIKKSDITEELLHSLCAKPEAKIILPHIDNPDKEKVIVVTGDPRSGTSLMMQSLRIAGFNISGDRFPMLNESSSEKEIDEDSIRHAIKMNPRGFYEVGGNVMGGFNKVSHEKFKNTVLKVISNGIKSTPSDLISHYILCLRDPKKISQSQINITNIMVSTGNGWDSPVNKASAFRYISGTGSMMVWLSEQSKDVQEKFVMVDNEDFRKNPTLEMESIFQHLGIEASPERVNAVSDNIDSSLVRSKSLKWESDAIVQGQLADNIYDALRRKDFGMMQVLKSEIQRIIEEEKLESVSYIDEEYQCYVSPSFIRQASQGENGLNGCKKSMLDLVEQSRRNGMLPEACNHQSRLIETYTIKLPFDIEDSEKKYVQCGRDHKKKTLEECFHCWQVGGMGFNGLGEFISLPAERIR